MASAPRFAAVLLIATAGLSLTVAVAGQNLLRSRRQPLTPAVAATDLWRVYRWSPDPDQRRRAALLMADSGHSLRGQGWGDAPLASVSLLLDAEAAEAQGDQAQADALWRQLLLRFPDEPSSARARQRFPERHQELLKRQPAHPAALATAAALDPDLSGGHQGALHLARWGWRWPGAGARIRQACATGEPSPQERQQLAWALSMQGAGTAAEACLDGAAATAETALALGRALLQGDSGQRRKGQDHLLTLIRNQPDHPASTEAVRLLMAPLFPDPAVVKAIPSQLAQRTAAVAAARARLNDGRGTLAVLERWPDDRDSWQLQWDEGREALLNEQWERAGDVLGALPAKTLPPALEARRLFWLGFSEARLGRLEQAQRHWRALQLHHPPGYYRWRAAAQLRDEQPLDLRSTDPSAASPTGLNAGWMPLQSGFSDVDRLWNLGLNGLAWDVWMQRRPRRRPLRPAEQLVEGQLRLSVDDPWNGLDQLWRLSVRWASPSCSQWQTLQRSQNPLPYRNLIQAAADQHRIHPALLLAIAKQESRFSPTIRSSAGAVGLLQLLPSTAAGLSDQALSETDLMKATINIPLGAAYLAELLNRWDGDPFRSIASYNAGPTTVASWPQPREEEAIELWVERIPYPETRYYTKKVLDNLLSYSGPSTWKCQRDEAGVRDGVPNQNATEQQAAQHEDGQRGRGIDADTHQIQPSQQQG